MRLRCGHCGKFIKFPYDEYANWGSYTDTEPPDHIYLCKKCAKGAEEEIANIKPPSLPYIPYYLGYCHYMGIIRSALVWIQERGSYFPKYERVAWPDSIPEGYEKTNKAVKSLFINRIMKQRWHKQYEAIEI